MISPFGILVLLYLFYFLLKKRSDNYLKMQHTILLSVVISTAGYGYLVRIPEFGDIKVLQIVTGVVIIYSFAISKYNKRAIPVILISAAAVLVSVLITSMIQVIDPKNYAALSGFGYEFNQYTVRSLIYLSMGIVLFCQMVGSKMPSCFFLRFEKMVVFSGGMLAGVALVENFVYEILGADIWRTAMYWFFGNSEVAMGVERGGKFMLSGLMTEPSALVGALIIPATLLFTAVFSGQKIFQGKKDGILLFLVFWALVASMSAMVVAVVGIIVISFPFYNRKPVRLILLLTVIGLFLSILSFYYPEMVDYYIARFIFLAGSEDIGSGIIRMDAIIDCLEIWAENPLFGAGLNTSKSFAFWPTVISNIGLVGTTLYLIMVGLALRHGWYFRGRKRVVLAYLVFLVCVSFASNMDEILFKNQYWLYLGIIGSGENLENT
ncbi:MAG: O-antigen ligase family protein [Negativicutes bacterium]